MEVYSFMASTSSLAGGGTLKISKKDEDADRPEVFKGAVVKAVVFADRAVARMRARNFIVLQAHSISILVDDVPCCIVVSVVGLSCCDPLCIL